MHFQTLQEDKQVFIYLEFSSRFPHTCRGQRNASGPGGESSYYEVGAPLQGHRARLELAALVEPVPAFPIGELPFTIPRPFQRSYVRTYVLLQDVRLTTRYNRTDLARFFQVSETGGSCVRSKARLRQQQPLGAYER